MKRPRLMGEINVTPLVDVMLVLLATFALTAPLLTTGIEVELPRAASTPLPELPTPIRISVDAHGRIWWGKQRVSLAQLRARAGALARRRPEAEVVLAADARTPYARVAKALAALQQGGLTKIALLTEPQR